MFASQKLKTRKTTARRRESEIAARLSAFDLTGGLRILRTNDAASAPETFERRLRYALESLGATFSAFGFYLSSRVDLLPAEMCLELSAITSAPASLSFADARQIYKNETGREPENDFLYISEKPFETRPFFQKHEAWLPDETAAVIKIINPDGENPFVEDVEFLHLLARVFARVISEKIFARAVEDFRSVVVRQFDLKNEARDFDSMKNDAGQFSMLCAPRVYHEFSGAKVLTVERIKGTSPADLLNENDAKETARLLCAVWLQQTLYGKTFPIVTGAENVILTDDKRIAFTDCAFAALEPETQLNLRRYLSAVAINQVDHATDFWFRELKDAAKSGEDNLRRHLRQIVLFRDSDWFRVGSRGEMLNLLLTHWRAATENGFTPQPALPAFYRGLFGTAFLAERLAPGGKSLVEGLEDARLLANLSDFRSLLSVGRLAADADKFGSLMFELPHRFDENFRVDRAGTRKFSSKRPAVQTSATALMMMAGAVVIIAPLLLAMFEESVWGKRLSFILFLLCGAWLLRVIGRAK